MNKSAIQRFVEKWQRLNYNAYNTDEAIGCGIKVVIEENCARYF